MRNKIIECRKLCKTYVLGKGGINVLKNIDLDIYEGDFTVIMGSSGSGKSTLLYSISTMDAPTSGDVILLGKNIKGLNEGEVSKLRKEEISFIFQSINLLTDLTSFENITYVGYGSESKDKVNKKALELLEKFNLLEVKDKYPSEMSGGQKQRVAICRALIGNAKIIFGDEPTGALNSSAGKEVLDSLTALNDMGQSIVMVTHDIKAATRATRLLYMEDGRIGAELNLGKYNGEKEKERALDVFEFLREQGW
ncbi:MAG: ABC transporter ATP-binding protein [Clostridium sp.]